MVGFRDLHLSPTSLHQPCRAIHQFSEPLSPSLSHAFSDLDFPLLFLKCHFLRDVPHVDKGVCLLRNQVVGAILQRDSVVGVVANVIKSSTWEGITIGLWGKLVLKGLEK